MARPLDLPPPAVRAKPRTHGGVSEPSRSRRANAPGPDAAASVATRPAPVAIDGFDRPTGSRTVQVTGPNAAPPQSPTSLAGLARPIDPTGVLSHDIIDTGYVLRNLDSGHLSMRIPMVAGARFAGFVIPEGCYLTGRIGIRDGSIDFADTTLQLQDASGRVLPSQGPLGIEAAEVYANRRGRLQLRLEGLPDPVITRRILGRGHGKLPSDPMELIGALADLVEGDAPEAGRRRLASLADMDGAQFTGAGVLKPGPLQIAAGAQVTVAAAPSQTHLTLEGDLASMAVRLSGHLDGLEFEAGGSHVSTGAGQVELSLRLPTTAALNPAGTAPEEIEIERLEVHDAHITLPTARGMHEVRIGHLAGTHDQGVSLRYHGAQDGKPARLALEAHEVMLRDVRAELQINGADGVPAHMTLRTAAESVQPVRATLELDTAQQRLALAGRGRDLQVQGQQLSLMQGDDLSLAVADYRGTAAHAEFSLVVDTQRTAVDLRALDADPMTVTWAGAAGSMLVASATTTFRLQGQTAGELALDDLHLSSDAHPDFHGHGRFTGSLDALDVPLPGGQHLHLPAGLQASAVITDLVGQQQDGTVRATAELTVALPEDILFDPGTIAGTDDASMIIDPGQSTLVLGTQIDAAGQAQLTVEVTLEDAHLAAQVYRGSADMPAAPQQLTELWELAAPSLAAARALPSRRAAAAPAHPSTPLQLGALSVDPAQVVRGIGDAEITLTLPSGPLDQPVFQIQNKGYTVSAGLSRAAGTLHGTLLVDDGSVQEGSELTLQPPLHIGLTAATGFAGQNPTATLGIEVVAVRVHATHDGLAVLRPDIRLNGDLGFVDFAVDLQAITGDLAPLLTHAVFGRTEVPLRADALIQALQQQWPDAVAPAIVQPGFPGITEPPQVIALPTDSLWAAAQGPIADSLRPQELQIALSANNAAPERLDLGNGQFVEFGAGSELEITGSATDFTLRGLAMISAASLHGGNYDLDLQGAEAEITMRVRMVEGQPQVTMELSQVCADSLVGSVDHDGTQTHIRTTNLDHGRLTLTSEPPTAPVLRFSGDSQHVEFSASGFLRGPLQASIDRVTGNGAGSVSFDGTTLEANLDHFALSGVGMASALVPGAQADHLSVSGAGILRATPRGFEATAAEGTQLSVPHLAAASPQGALQLHDATVQRVQLSPGSPPSMAAYGIRGFAELQTVLPSDLPVGAGATIDVRRVLVHGGDVVLGPAAVHTPTPLRFSQLDAIAEGLPIAVPQNGALMIRRGRAQGAGTLNLSPSGAIRLLAGPDAPLSLVGIAEPATLAIAAPQVQVSTRAGAVADLRIRELSLGPQGQSADLSGEVRFQLSGGTLNTGSEGALFDTVPIPDGSRGSLVLDHARLSTDDAEQVTALELAATLQIVGPTGAAVEGIMDLALAEGETTARSTGGQFRLAASIVATSTEDHATHIVADLDGLAFDLTGSLATGNAIKVPQRLPTNPRLFDDAR